MGCRAATCEQPASEMGDWRAMRARSELLERIPERDGSDPRRKNDCVTERRRLRHPQNTRARADETTKRGKRRAQTRAGPTRLPENGHRRRPTLTFFSHHRRKQASTERARWRRPSLAIDEKPPPPPVAPPHGHSSGSSSSRRASDRPSGWDHDFQSRE